MSLRLDPARRPIYVHCQHGVDRTGTIMAIYRMELEGWSNLEAFAEMDHFGAHRIWMDLRNFVRGYKPLGVSLGQKESELVAVGLKARPGMAG